MCVSMGVILCILLLSVVVLCEVQSVHVFMVPIGNLLFGNMENLLNFVHLQHS